MSEDIPLVSAAEELYNFATMWYQSPAPLNAYGDLSEDDQNSWSEAAEKIVEAGVQERTARFRRSFDIPCPKCGMVAGSCCINFGSGGGPHNCAERINAVKS